MYLHRLDGRIGIAYFDEKSAKWGGEQHRLLRDIEKHQAANQTYFEEGIRLLELARNAANLFQMQPAGEKRRLLDFVLSNCSWKDGKLTATLRQPFDVIAGTVANDAAAQTAGGGTEGRSEIWLRLLDSNQRPGG